MAVFQLLWGFGVKVLLFLFVLLFIAFLGYCLYIKYVHMKYDHIPGPPRNSFIFGHSPTFADNMKNDININDKFLEWCETYGPVCRLNALHHVFLIVTCPEASKEILMNQRYPKDKLAYKRIAYLFGQRRNQSFRYLASCLSGAISEKHISDITCVVDTLKNGTMRPSDPPKRTIRLSAPDAKGKSVFLGSGLATTHDHEVWYKQRRIMDPAFSSLYLRGLIGTFNERAETLMDTLADVADNKQETKMLYHFNCVTLDVIAKVAFGMDLDLLKGNSPFPKAIETCLKGMVYHTRDFLFEYKPQNRGFLKKVSEACHLLRTTGAQWIQKRKTAMQNGEEVPKDILTQIIKSAAAENMTEEDEEFMLDNFVTFFIAGQETTANQLAFCVMELGRHPEILEKVRKEVDDVIGMKKEIGYDDLGKLIYLSQVLKETLRMYPTAPGTSRLIVEDMLIDGVHIPGGVSCMLNSYVTGRMERFFKEPLKFDPDRFHPDAPKPYYCYFPFSLGHRSCLGQNFAQMEAKVVMAKLLQRFDFILAPGQTFDIQDTGSLRPKSGVVCYIKHRK